MKYKISIVTPVYNSKKYIRKCIESIICQTYSYWELILIDDGSSDGSEEICDQYAVLDSRIKVIHKKNEGVTSARNDGIKYISGQYLLFVDSDDYIEPETLEILTDKVLENNYDIVMFGHHKMYENKETNISESDYQLDCSVMDQEHAMKNIYFYGGMLWNKFIKVSLFKNNNITFNKDLNASEDWLFVLQLITKGRNFLYIKDKLYTYVVRENSISRNDNLNKFLRYNRDAVEGFEACIEYLNVNWPQYSKYMIAVMIRFEMRSIVAITKYKTAKKENYIEMVNHIQKYKKSEYYTKYIKWYCKFIKIHPRLFKAVWKFKDIIKR